MSVPLNAPAEQTKHPKGGTTAIVGFVIFGVGVVLQLSMP
jgi:hypothetical protein